ncbi:hypothetical protein U1Q18_028541 [Sarracenia purpurea var. burkii]
MRHQTKIEAATKDTTGKRITIRPAIPKPDNSIIGDRDWEKERDSDTCRWSLVQWAVGAVAWWCWCNGVLGVEGCGAVGCCGVVLGWCLGCWWFLSWKGGELVLGCGEVSGVGVFWGCVWCLGVDPVAVGSGAFMLLAPTAKGYLVRMLSKSDRFKIWSRLACT